MCRLKDFIEQNSTDPGNGLAFGKTADKYANSHFLILCIKTHMSVNL